MLSVGGHPHLHPLPAAAIAPFIFTLLLTRFSGTMWLCPQPRQRAQALPAAAAASEGSQRWCLSGLGTTHSARSPGSSWCPGPGRSGECPTGAPGRRAGAWHWWGEWGGWQGSVLPAHLGTRGVEEPPQMHTKELEALLQASGCRLSSACARSLPTTMPTWVLGVAAAADPPPFCCRCLRNRSAGAAPLPCSSPSPGKGGRSAQCTSSWPHAPWRCAWLGSPCPPLPTACPPTWPPCRSGPCSRAAAAWQRRSSTSSPGEKLRGHRKAAEHCGEICCLFPSPRVPPQLLAVILAAPDFPVHLFSSCPSPCLCGPIRGHSLVSLFPGAEITAPAFPHHQLLGRTGIWGIISPWCPAPHCSPPGPRALLETQGPS